MRGIISPEMHPQLQAQKKHYCSHLLYDELPQIDTKLTDLEVELLSRSLELLDPEVGRQARVGRDADEIGHVVQL